jgi:hypothetical protein
MIGDNAMTTTDQIRPAYTEIHALIAQHGGNMTWRPMGRGGDWVIDLHGKTAVVRCRDRNVNPLDHLYEAKVPTPKTWDDYELDAPLLEGAFWKLIDLVRSESQRCE